MAAIMERLQQPLPAALAVYTLMHGLGRLCPEEQALIVLQLPMLPPLLPLVV